MSDSNSGGPSSTTPNRQQPGPRRPLQDRPIHSRVDEVPMDRSTEVTEVTAETPEVEGEPSVSNSVRDAAEWIAVVVVALVAALVIREYVVQAFEIPSQSMEDTVNVGDRILVNKLSYSIGEVDRGDLVVFERGNLIAGDTDELIKRAIALPGETIEVRSDGNIYIWGPEEGPEDAFLLPEPYLSDSAAQAFRIGAGIPVTSDVWHERCLNQPREVGRCTLDDNSFFVLGDNRGNSADSRVFGPVPAENVVGEAFFRIWPISAVGGF